MRKAAALMIALALVAGGCSKSSEDPSNPLSSLLISSGPKGYELTQGPVSGPQDVDGAASSVGFIGSSKVRRQLSTTGFQEGYTRLWEKGDDYAYAVAFDFLNANRAKEFVTFLGEGLKDKQTAVAYTVEGIPDSVGFTFNAVKSKGQESLFCQVAAFSVATHAFDVYTCGAQPTSAATVQDLARRQFKAAA